jgi:L-seryl-tRNA(Ser) seleniumtransferase
MTLAALEATLRLYLDPQAARREVPTLSMISATADELARRAGALAAFLADALGDAVRVSQAPGQSRVGGGSFPECDLPTTLVGVEPADGTGADELRARLLNTAPPLVGRIEDDRFLLDPRTLRDDEFSLAAGALAQALGIDRV